MSVNWNKVDEAALALMHLTAFTERDGAVRTRKGFDWDILDRMFERGWISDPQTKARSVVVFADAVRLSRELFEQQFGTIDPPTPGGTPPRLRQGRPSPRCECGCGTAVQGRTFVPGHDQKLRIQLESRVGGPLKLRDVLERLEEHARGQIPVETLSDDVRAAFERSGHAGQLQAAYQALHPTRRGHVWQVGRRMSGAAGERQSVSHLEEATSREPTGGRLRPPTAAGP